MMIDNQSALAIIMNPEHHGWMKHVHVNFHWIHQVVQRKQIALCYFSTGEMMADILTKVLPHLLIK